MAFLLTAGYYKESLTFLPLDATVLAAALVAIACIRSALFNRPAIPRQVLWISLCFYVFAMGGLFASLDDYSTSKLMRLFTLTLLATVAPLVIVRESLHVRRFFHFAAGIGIAVSIAAILGPKAPQFYGRLTAVGTDPIALGRAAGLPVIWLLLMAFNRRLSVPVASILSLPLLVALIGAGQRGPLLALLVALVIALIFSPGMTRALGRKILMASLVAAAAIYVLGTAPEASVERLLEIGKSTDRLTAWRETLGVIKTQPVGVGWGDWGDHVETFADHARPYPHNLVLEIFSEAGWLAGIVFVALFAAALFRGRQGASSLEGQAIFAGLIFAFVNAMVSGDINDNRMVWMMLGLALAWYGMSRRAKSEFPQWRTADVADPVTLKGLINRVGGIGSVHGQRRPRSL